ncbi:type II secretion system protein GspG [Catellatospora sichuanensis]|uniref:type II secretion system protein GspG n=1 Tax=Catellatospora sichuanensis TaxID=1969805 RepID=UPI001C92A16A|nr:type II secretion system protein GspG [Catellatospora sichuanensis]
MDLVNSKRVLLTASYVTVELTEEERSHAARVPGRALDKLSFVRQLKASPEDVAWLEGMAGSHGEESVREGMASLARLLRGLDDAGRRSGIAREAATVPAAAIERFADQLVERRGGGFTSLVARVFARRVGASPVGTLHLERLEMYPAGTEQGELVFTVPMTPMETVTISHKEWSTSSQEYENIVSDYFETYSERGVAEKTDASMSAENERRHSSAFDFGASYTGSGAGVSLTVAVGLKNATETRESVKQSAQRSREITEKASARARQEHKVSVKLATRQGVEDISLRTLTNPYEDRAIRVDYFRMMRKWRTDLFRYGMRLTFDLAVPNPGARLWAQYRRLAELDRQLAEPFAFKLAPYEITDGTWRNLERTHQITLDPPPRPEEPKTVKVDLEAGKGAIIEFVPPPGYRVQPTVTCILSYWGGFNTEPLLNISDENWRAKRRKLPNAGSGSGDGVYEISLDTFGGDDRRTVQLIAGAGTEIKASFRYTVKLTPEHFEAWQHKCWTALREAQAVAHRENAARLQEERDRLWRRLAGSDTLSLRRLEREELVRCTLLWLLGADFDAAPDDVGEVVQRLLRFETDDLSDDGLFGVAGGAATRRLSQSEWLTASGFGDLVKFLHHAVEWENLLYFLYPYFWGSDDLGREKMLFDHPDPAHRDFLRAGYVRVVIPVRPGFEHDLIQLLDTGVFGGTGNSPYLSLGEEVAAFGRTNYTGIPPANPELHARPLLYPQQRATWETMQRVVRAIEVYHEANGRHPAQLSELPIPGPFTDAWGRELVYRLPGSGNDYDLISFGADGAEGGTGLDADISAGAGASLVASWFDYSPTSGLDISIDVKPAAA